MNFDARFHQIINPGNTKGVNFPMVFETRRIFPE